MDHHPDCEGWRSAGGTWTQCVGECSNWPDVVHVEYDIPVDVASFLFELALPGHLSHCTAATCLADFRDRVVKEAGELLAAHSHEVAA